MELNLQRQSITINEVIFDGNTEQPVECDALLPDYCPDIVKVLKCTISTHIHSTAVNGDRLTIEGMAVAHIYYASERSSVRHVEYKIPFGKMVELRMAPQNPVVSVLPRVDYVNCRPVNQRRVDVRGAITIGVKVQSQREEQVISGAEGAGLQLRREMVNATEMMGQSSMQFPVMEDLEIGYGKGQVGSVVRIDSRVNVQDHKIVAGKVVAKGDFLLHVLYATVETEEKLEVMEYSLPISQIIDAEGVDEDCLCDVVMVVGSCDVQPRANEEGEYTGLSLDAKVQATVTAHRHKDIPVASDCYSTQFECKSKGRPVTFFRLVDMVRETLMHKVSLDLPEGVRSVLDAWCDVENFSWKYEESSLRCEVRLTVCMFAGMEEGEVLYFEQPTEMEHTIPVEAPCESILFEPSCDVLTSAYTLMGKEKIDIRCEVLLKGNAYCNIKKNSLGEIEVDETQIKQKRQNKLYLYYANRGESVWSIAKEYNTASGAIWEENDLENDALREKRMLLIPIV